MTQPPDTGLARLRLAAGWTFLALIVVLALASLTDVVRNVDPAMFLTLVGALLATVGAGSVIRLFGPK